MTKYDPEKSREYYLAHREERIAKQSAWYTANREKALTAGRRWAARNQEKCREYSRRAAQRFREMREAKAAEQGFLCPCGEALGDERALDHDHKCCDKTVRSSCRGCDREVMHMLCNRIIGMVNDDSAKLRRLADYLDRYQEKL